MQNQDTTPIYKNRFSDKVALVTGAGQGIGRAVAIRLAAEGAIVGVLDWNAVSTAGVVEIIKGHGGYAVGLQADVSKQDQVTNCVEKLQSTYGRVDLLINNAGFDRPGGFLKLTGMSFVEVFNVHVLGAVNCILACAPIMIDQRDGRIVNVSSIYGKVGAKGESAYCSAKSGLVGFTKSLAREFASKGVRINVVMPGLTATPTIREMMNPKYQEAFVRETPLGRLADPDEIAAPISFLLSDEASFITGAVLEVTGGWGM